MTDVLQGLHSLTLHVRDTAAIRGYYRDVLGLKEVTFDPKLNRAVFSIPGSSTLLTMHVMAPTEGGREPGTVSGIVFHAADVPGAVAELKRRGGIVILEPTAFEAGGRTFHRAVFADPDGNEFLLSDRTD